MKLVALILGAVLASCGTAPRPTPSRTQEAPSTCEVAQGAPAFRQLLSDLDAVASVEAWPGYRLADHDIVFTWTGEGSQCVAHWSKGHVVTDTTTDTPLDLMLGVFGFLITELGAAPAPQRMGGFLAGDVPLPILDSLRTAGAAGALVWVVNGLEGPSPVADFIEADPRLWALFLILHESVHMHLQFAGTFAGDTRHRYPTWSVQPSRDELVARCLNAPPAQENHAGEMNENAAAVASAQAGDVSGAEEHMARFVALRTERYETNAAVRVSGQGGASLTCEDAEAIWELDEGIADFIAARTLIESGLYDGQFFAQRVHSRNSGDADYYHSGAGQLFVLWKRDPSGFSAIADAILRSTEPTGGIFGQTQRALASDQVR